MLNSFITHLGTQYFLIYDLYVYKYIHVYNYTSAPTLSQTDITHTHTLTNTY